MQPHILVMLPVGFALISVYLSLRGYRRKLSTGLRVIGSIISVSPITIDIMYGPKSIISHSLQNTSVPFDLRAFSRLSKADKAKVMEAKIKLIAYGNASDVDPALASFTQRAFATVLSAGNILAPTALIPTAPTCCGALGPVVLAPYAERCCTAIPQFRI
jgi:hypothetical protein